LQAVQVVGGGLRFFLYSPVQRPVSFSGETRLELVWRREVRANWATRRRR